MSDRKLQASVVQLVREDLSQLLNKNWEISVLKRPMAGRDWSSDSHAYKSVIWEYYLLINDEEHYFSLDVDILGHLEHESFIWSVPIVDYPVIFGTLRYCPREYYLKDLWSDDSVTHTALDMPDSTEVFASEINDKIKARLNLE